MGDAAAPRTPVKRDARGAPVANQKMCIRCVQYIHDREYRSLPVGEAQSHRRRFAADTRVVDQEDYDIVWEGTTMRKRCSRCAKGKRTGYEPVTHEDLVPALNATLRARDALANLPNNVDDAEARRTLDRAQSTLNNRVRSYHQAKNKTIGDTPMSRKQSAAVPLASLGGTGGMELEEMQRLRRAGNALAVGMREVCGPQTPESRRVSC